jgi:hypothetical protein
MQVKFYQALVVYSRSISGQVASVRRSGRMFTDEEEARATFGKDFIRLLSDDSVTVELTDDGRLPRQLDD